MRAFVRLQGPDGKLYELSHGDIIGRLWSAAMPVDDVRVSEAHAMVSLRGEELKLLALRGLFAIGRRPIRELTLVPGQKIRLARGVTMSVVAVELPAQVLALKGPGMTPQVLVGACALMLEPPRLVSGYQDNAAALLWSMGNTWRIQRPGEEAAVLEAGSKVRISGQTFEAMTVALSQATQGATGFRSVLHPPMRIITRFDTVHFHREGQEVFSISGIPARILSELAVVGAPVSWLSLAQEIWREDTDRSAMRRKWDVNLARLRKKLQGARIRPDLVRADGSGNFELVRYPGDVVVDEG